MRITALANIMPKFSMEDITEALEKHKRRFVQKHRAIYILSNNLKLVDEGSKIIWI